MFCKWLEASKGDENKVRFFPSMWGLFQVTMLLGLRCRNKVASFSFSHNLHRSYYDNPPGCRYCFPPSDTRSNAWAPCCLTAHKRQFLKLHPNTDAASHFVAPPVWSRFFLEQSSLQSFKNECNQSFFWFLFGALNMFGSERSLPRAEDPVGTPMSEMLHRHGDGLPAVAAPTDTWICMDECQDCINTSALWCECDTKVDSCFLVFSPLCFSSHDWNPRHMSQPSGVIGTIIWATQRHAWP